MTQLSMPHRQLKDAVCAEFDYDQHMVGYRMRPRSGPMVVHLYSFQEVVGFLNDAFPLIDFDDLSHWLNTVIKDRELAQQVKRLAGSPLDDHEKTIRIREMMTLRLNQCRQRAHTPKDGSSGIEVPMKKHRWSVS